MSATITFTHNATVLVLPSPNYPGELHPGRPQIKGGAVGGRAWVSDLGDGTSLRQPKLTWRGLPKSYWDDLYDFIETEVNRSAEPFQFLDWNAVEITVKYWSGIESFQEVKHARFAGTLGLRQEPA